MNRHMRHSHTGFSTRPSTLERAQSHDNLCFHFLFLLVARWAPWVLTQQTRKKSAHARTDHSGTQQSASRVIPCVRLCAAGGCRVREQCGLLYFRAVSAYLPPIAALRVPGLSPQRRGRHGLASPPWRSTPRLARLGRGRTVSFTRYAVGPRCRVFLELPRCFCCDRAVLWGSNEAVPTPTPPATLLQHRHK